MWVWGLHQRILSRICTELCNSRITLKQFVTFKIIVLLIATEPKATSETLTWSCHNFDFLSETTEENLTKDDRNQIHNFIFYQDCILPSWTENKHGCLGLVIGHQQRCTSNHEHDMMTFGPFEFSNVDTGSLSMKFKKLLPIFTKGEPGVECLVAYLLHSLNQDKKITKNGVK